MLGIAIHCIQHSQAMLERGVCELAHSFFHFSSIGVTIQECVANYISLAVSVNALPRL